MAVWRDSEEKDRFLARLDGLAERCREARLDADQHVAAFARRADMPAVTVARVEAGGRVDMSVHTLARIAAAGGVTMDWLYWGDDDAEEAA